MRTASRATSESRIVKRRRKFRRDAETDFPRYLWNTLIGSMRSNDLRFNAECEFGAIYMALDADTPVRELERTYARSATSVQPEDRSARRILLTLDVHLTSIADLRDADECAVWGTTLARVTGDDRAHTRVVGRDVRQQREAIRDGSATGSGENLAIFHDKLRPKSRIDLLEAQPLDIDWRR